MADLRISGITPMRLRTAVAALDQRLMAALPAIRVTLNQSTPVSESNRSLAGLDEAFFEGVSSDRIRSAQGPGPNQGGSSVPVACGGPKT